MMKATVGMMAMWVSNETAKGEAAGKTPGPAGGLLAYRRLPARAKDLPTVVFLGGFNSDMMGSKATALAAFCAARGQAFLRFDYSNHGASDDTRGAGTIGLWRDDALAVVDRLTTGPLVVVGSSMGGWLMVLVARARRVRVCGLVGVAAAPDFTEDLIWNRLDTAQRETLMKAGSIALPSAYDSAPYTITRDLIEEARAHLLLRETIALDCPVRLLHGMADKDVPYQTTLRLAEKLTSRDVVVTLVKDGDHRLSRPQDLARLIQSITELSGDAKV